VIILRIIALPFLPLYGLATLLRNGLYRVKGMRASSFDLPVINVGNLSTGGTGKSPHTEYMVRLLQPDYPVATLSRGYGRRTKGYREVLASDTSTEAGDEPLQFRRKFDERVRVFVDENRVRGVLNLLYDFPEADVVVLDDAFQHRAIEPGLNILLTEYSQPFYSDYILPIGDLREFRTGAQRADAVVVTKCPNMTLQDRQTVEKRVGRYSDAPVFFSRIVYGNLVPVTEAAKSFKISKVLLVTGIANHEPLLNHLSEEHEVVRHMRYRDHYAFRPSDFDQIRKIFSTFGGSGLAIVTTEKDAVRMHGSAGFDAINGLPLFYQEITVDFGNDRNRFDDLIKNYVGKNKADRNVSE
jgi:tetraacyldisaccharide 4'-kinase